MELRAWPHELYMFVCAYVRSVLAQIDTGMSPAELRALPVVIHEPLRRGNHGSGALPPEGLPSAAEPAGAHYTPAQAHLCSSRGVKLSRDVNQCFRHCCLLSPSNSLYRPVVPPVFLCCERHVCQKILTQHLAHRHASKSEVEPPPPFCFFKCKCSKVGINLVCNHRT